MELWARGRWSAVGVAVGLALGCARQNPRFESKLGTTSGPASTEDDAGTTAAAPPLTGSAEATDDPDESEPGTTSIADPTTGGVDGETTADGAQCMLGAECNPFGEPCDGGLRCVPAAGDGTVGTDVFHCIEPHPLPVGQGDPCIFECPGDNCPAGSTCVYAATGESGRCRELCQTADDCSANTPCRILGGEVMICAKVTCDPFDPASCPVGEVCVPEDDQVVCLPDASGPDGQEGDGCAELNGCDPGLVCVPSAMCGSQGCCARWCEDDGECDLGDVCIPLEGLPAPLAGLSVCVPS
ncbi:MAG: hypothetical protein AAF721_15215 [Myxococcota bacterium]